MTPAQPILPGVPPLAAGDRDHWTTPRDLFEQLNREFAFICDCAASEENALCDQRIGEEEDALTVDWPQEGWCFLNPPFSMLPEFLAKVWEQNLLGARIVVLVPGHRHEQRWFHDYVIDKADEVRIPRGRICYQAPEGIPSGSPTFPSMVLVYQHRAKVAPGTAWTRMRAL